MKKSILALGLLSILVLPSCKKDWNCRCVDQSGNSSSSVIKDQTLSNANDQCRSKSYSVTVGGATASQDCNLQ